MGNLRLRIGEKLPNERDYNGFRFFYPNDGIEIEDDDKTKLREIFYFTGEDNVAQVCFLPNESPGAISIQSVSLVTSDHDCKILLRTEILELKANEGKEVDFIQARWRVSIMI